MKHIKKLSTFHFPLSSLAALLMLVACGKDNTSPIDTIPIDTVPERNIPTGNIPTPGWAVVPGYDYSSSMTAVVEVDLMSVYPDLTPVDWQVDTADRLGAFAGVECIGVIAPTDALFFLYMVAPSQSGADITLRYYSARLHNIFQGDTVLHFENGARVGTVAEPLKPLFTN